MQEKYNCLLVISMFLFHCTCEKDIELDRINFCLLIFFSLAPIACSAGWSFYGSSCYKFSSLRKKWIDAKKDCRASGGYLLKINDANEQHYITYKQSQGYRVS